MHAIFVLKYITFQNNSYRNLHSLTTACENTSISNESKKNIHNPSEQTCQPWLVFLFVCLFCFNSFSFLNGIPDMFHIMIIGSLRISSTFPAWQNCTRKWIDRQYLQNLLLSNCLFSVRNQYYAEISWQPYVYYIIVQFVFCCRNFWRGHACLLDGLGQRE